MACLAKEKKSSFRIHWKFRVRLGPRAGDTIEGSLYLGRCTLASAKVKKREIDEWEDRVRTGRFVPDRSFQDVLDSWLTERRLACTPQTVIRDVRVIKAYLRWRTGRGLANNTIEVIGQRDDIIAWRDHRLAHEASRKTVASDLSTFSAFFEWCTNERLLMDNPMRRVTRPRFTMKQEGRPLTRTQAGQWLKSIRPRHGETGGRRWSWDDVRRKRQLIVFLLNTGLRNGELCSLNIEDLRLDGDERMANVLGKGLKTRWVPLNRAALAAIRCHLRSRGCPLRGPVFTTASGGRYNVRQLGKEIKKTARCCELDIQVNPHNLRHTFGTWLAKASSDMAITQKVMGHENVNTTAKYYIHTGDHELYNATACLKPKALPQTRATTKTPPPATEECGDGDAWVIPFPVKQVS